MKLPRGRKNASFISCENSLPKAWVFWTHLLHAHFSVTPRAGASSALNTQGNAKPWERHRGPPLTKEWASSRISLLSLVIALNPSRDGYSKGPGTVNLQPTQLMCLREGWGKSGGSTVWWGGVALNWRQGWGWNPCPDTAALWTQACSQPSRVSISSASTGEITDCKEV